MGGFEEVQLVYVANTDSKNSSNQAQYLRGIYYKRPGLCFNKPYYQRIHMTGGRGVCTAMHISWSQAMEAWKIGYMNIAGVGICTQDVEDPLLLSVDWKLFAKKDDGTADA